MCNTDLLPPLIFSFWIKANKATIFATEAMQCYFIRGIFVLPTHLASPPLASWLPLHAAAG